MWCQVSVGRVLSQGVLVSGYWVGVVVNGDALSVQNTQSTLMHAEVWCMGNALNKSVCWCTTEKAWESAGKHDMQHAGQGRG